MGVWKDLVVHIWNARNKCHLQGLMEVVKLDLIEMILIGFLIVCFQEKKKKNQTASEMLYVIRTASEMLYVIRISIAQTLMARLPWQIQTHF